MPPVFSHNALMIILPPKTDQLIVAAMVPVSLGSTDLVRQQHAGRVVQELIGMDAFGPGALFYTLRGTGMSQDIQWSQKEGAILIIVGLPLSRVRVTTVLPTVVRSIADAVRQITMALVHASSRSA